MINCPKIPAVEKKSEDVLYEDDEMLVINKPKDLVVHPAPGNWTGTLVPWLLEVYKESQKSKQSEIHVGFLYWFFFSAFFLVWIRFLLGKWQKSGFPGFMFNHCFVCFFWARISLFLSLFFSCYVLILTCGPFEMKWTWCCSSCKLWYTYSHKVVRASALRAAKGCTFADVSSTYMHVDHEYAYIVECANVVFSFFVFTHVIMVAAHILAFLILHSPATSLHQILSQ